MAKVLRVGIIGAGGIVLQRHLPGLLAVGDIEIAAVANSSIESARQFCAERLPGARAVSTWQELIELPELDVIWIGAHPNLHHPGVLAALRAGKHVFCQARMAMNLTQAEEMLAESELRPNLVTMLCPPPQGLRYDASIRSLIQDGTLGRIHHVKVESRNSSFLDPSQPAHWRQRKEISGVNILTLGIYIEILQRWLGDISSVQAEGRIATPVRQGYQIEIPDQLDVLAAFSCGAAGNLSFSAIHPGPAQDTIEISGDQAILRYEFPAETLALGRPGSSSWVPLPVPPEFDRPWQVEQDFITAVRAPETPRPHPDFRDGVAYMKVVQSVHAALSVQTS